jgi:DNA mismatch repair protein MutL
VIAELPEAVRNQIAAGEVVERPASVVKELVENSLDAGAKRVRVELEEGGSRLVRIVDDGVGMIAEDMELAFRPHATSKLRDVGDLEHIASLGFRGEALASIGSIARCRILSRPHDVALGNTIENEGGRVTPVREAGGPVGTSIEVRDLFYNTPARRKFMKRPGTELSRCLDILQRIALAHPGVGFEVLHDGKRVLDVEASMDLRDRIRRLFGAELADALEPVHSEDGTTLLEGFVAPPRFSRRDTSRQMWFLNGRPLRDKVLIRALKEGYRGYLADRQPICFLSLSMDPAAVDVNVHPTKTEVRFRDQRRLFGFLVNSVREAVRRTDIATPGGTLLESARRRGGWSPGEGALQPALPDPGKLGPRAGDAPVVRELPGAPGSPPPPVWAPAGQGVPTEPAPAPIDGVEPAWPANDDLSGPYLQVAKTYLLRSVPEGFEIIDQHALHERVTFEGLRAEVRAGKVPVQRLLVPELVEVSRADAELLGVHAEGLGRLGIEVEPFGPTTIAVHGLPARVRRPDPDGLVRDLIEVLARTGKPPEAEDVLEEVLHRAACRSSVMAGDELDEAEIRALLERARQLETDQTCPHGRPTRVRFTLEDLEKAFHRR